MSHTNRAASQTFSVEEFIANLLGGPISTEAIHKALDRVSAARLPGHGDDGGSLSRESLREIDTPGVFFNAAGAEPTDNRAERALRSAVPRRKRLNGTQSAKGNRWGAEDVDLPADWPPEAAGDLPAQAGTSDPLSSQRGSAVAPSEGGSARRERCARRVSC
jgi:hypothetical protein